MKKPQVAMRRWFYFHILPERKLAARDLPKAVAAFCTEHEADPFFGWVVATYGRYRHRDV